MALRYNMDIKVVVEKTMLEKTMFCPESQAIDTNDANGDKV